MGKPADDLLERLMSEDPSNTPEVLELVVQMRRDSGRVVNKRERRHLERVLETHDALCARIRAHYK